MSAAAARTKGGRCGHGAAWGDHGAGGRSPQLHGRGRRLGLQQLATLPLRCQRAGGLLELRVQLLKLLIRQACDGQAQKCEPSEGPGAAGRAHETRRVAP